MRRSNVIKCMQALGLKPRDRGHDWIESNCPFAPWTHKRGWQDRDGTFAVSLGIQNLYACQQCHRKGRLEWLPSSIAEVNRDPDEQERLWSLAADFERVQDEDILTMDLTEEVTPMPWLEEAWRGIYVPLAESDEGTAYAASRGISPATAAKLDMRWHVRMNHVFWPLRDSRGDLWGFLGRNARDDGKRKTWNQTGTQKSLSVLGSHLWKPGLPLFLVEGLVGFAHLHEIGADAVCNVGAIMGSTMSREQAAIACTNEGKRVLAFDNDGPGLEGLVEALKLFSWEYPVSAPAWPTWKESGTHHGGVHAAGDEKEDPDQLTLEDVVDMLDSPVVNSLHVPLEFVANVI